jgi:hypothetical protein
MRGVEVNTLAPLLYPSLLLSSAPATAGSPLSDSYVAATETPLPRSFLPKPFPTPKTPRLVSTRTPAESVLLFSLFLSVFFVFNLIQAPTNWIVIQSVLGVILGGGAGTRLYPLTKKRAKPAVPLGANYRLIDIPVSNCLNSNISKIYVLTQFNSASLNRHLSRAYASNLGGYKNEGFVEVLAAQQSPENPNWFQVTCL